MLEYEVELERQYCRRVLLRSPWMPSEPNCSTGTHPTRSRSGNPNSTRTMKLESRGERGKRTPLPTYRLLLALLAAPYVPGVTAKDDGFRHNHSILPRRATVQLDSHHGHLQPIRREVSNNDWNGQIPISVTNNCFETIWPGITTQNGTGPGTGGFELPPGIRKDMWVSPNWQGRIWGRSNCTVNGNSCSCETGDCFGEMDCKFSVRRLSAGRDMNLS
jgi:Thaumatin family